MLNSIIAAQMDDRGHLSTLGDGGPHPAAQTAVLSYTFAPADNVPINLLDMSISGFRLAVLRGTADITSYVVVWDWTTGQTLLVSRLFMYSPTVM